jgi:CMP/dCMP kinase
MTVITISRQYGSGGDEIALRVCKTLKYRYFDKHLLSQLIRQEHLTPEQIVDYHEDTYMVRSFLDKLRGYRPPPANLRQREGNNAARAGETTDPVDENMMIWLVDAAIHAAYAEGNIVIVGRGGQVILHDKLGVLHVRIEAPLADRIRRVCDAENMNESNARQMLAQYDASAADYLKRFYHSNWADPLLYHMVINTGHWSVTTAARLIIEAARLVGPQIAIVN